MSSTSVRRITPRIAVATLAAAGLVALAVPTVASAATLDVTYTDATAIFSVTPDGSDIRGDPWGVRIADTFVRVAQWPEGGVFTFTCTEDGAWEYSADGVTTEPFTGFDFVTQPEATGLFELTRIELEPSRCGDEPPVVTDPPVITDPPVANDPPAATPPVKPKAVETGFTASTSPAAAGTQTLAETGSSLS